MPDGHGDGDYRYASWAELQEVHAELWHEIQRLNRQGSDGLGVLRAEVADQRADLADLRARITEQGRSRIEGNRWLIGLGVGMLTVIVGIITVVIETLTRLH